MEEPFKTLIVVSHYLETGRFRQFWEEEAKSRRHQHVNSGWTVEKVQGRGKLIVIPRNEFNHPETKKNTVEMGPA